MPEGSPPSSRQTEETFYEVLGVARSASPQEIQAAFARRARQYHPDHNPNSPPSLMVRLNEAYRVLRTPALRRGHDADLLKRDLDRLAAAADEKRKAEAVRKQKAEEERQAAQRERDRLRQALFRARYGALEDHVRSLARNNRQRPGTSHQSSIDFHDGFRLDTSGLSVEDLWAIVHGHCIIRVVGQPGFQRDGFTIPSPVDRQGLRFPPDLNPGRHVLQSRGGFPAPAGGRGDLILDYSWPRPVTGADREVTLNYRTPRRGKGISFTPVTDGPTFDVQDPQDGERLTLRGYGEPGEFGGLAGDMHLTLREETTLAGRTRAAATTALASALGWWRW